MITRLQGRLLEKHPTDIVLDVQGVGYQVFVPLSVFAELPDCGQTIVLHTHFVVRDDAQQLFGFLHRDERALFQELIKVSGIGPRLGLTLLSGMDRAAFVRCVRESNVAALVKLPGIGRKTAERLVVELRDRLPETQASGVAAVSLSQALAGGPRAEAESALLSLGYKPAQAAQTVQAILKTDPDASVESLIRQALRDLGRTAGSKP